MIRTRKTGVIDHGGNGDVVVLLHGFLATSRYWIKLQPYLSAAGYRVIAIDLLGFGRAPKPRNTRYGYTDHIAHVDRVIKSLGISEPFILIGHSMGALLATRYVQTFPEMTKALILLHPPLYKNANEARVTLRQTSRIYRFLLDSRYRRIGWMLMKTISHRHTGNHSRIAREQSLKNVIEKAEILDDLKTISTNTLLVVGMKDRPEYVANLTAAKLSHSVTVIKEDVAHHSPIREPQLVQEKILDFLKLSTHR